MASETDAELLERWRGGDRAAGEALTRRHFEALVRFFQPKVGNDVDDLLQQTFLGLVQGKERFESRSSVRTYLFAIARNQLLAYFRKRKRDQPFDAELHSVADTQTTPSAFVERARDRRALLEALRRLPLDQQIALELSYWEGLNSTELGEVLGTSASTVRTRLQRARTALERILTELSDDPSQLQSTLDGLSAWAARIRDEIGAEGERTVAGRRAET